MEHQPTVHILRPHHITLLAVILVALKEIESKNLAPAFSLHIYRVLLNEVIEIVPPKTWSELLDALGACPSAGEKSGPQMMSILRAVNFELSDPTQLSNFFASIPSLFLSNKAYDTEPSLLRRHILGYFCRRCFVSFLKLSFEGVIKYHQDYVAWCNGDREAGYDIVHKDSLDNSYLLLLKSNVDKKTWADSRSFEIFEAGLANGDMLTGEEHLRWFFEQRFHEGHDSGLRQHAVLNLARHHYVREEYPAARKYLTEGITTARTAGDRFTLQHCISLLNRLPPVEVGRKPVLNEIQPTSHPLEVLFDAKKLMDTDNGQNLGATFAKLAEVLGMLDHYSETQLIDSEVWAHHAVQSVTWNAIGCDRLTVIEEDIVTAFTVVGGDDNNRITVILNRAYRQARQGQYEAALAILLEPDIWRGLTIRDYSLWANQVWHILALRASRRKQERIYREVLLPRQPLGEVDSNDYFFYTCNTKDKIRGQLYEVLRLREFGQASTAIEQLLTALWHAEFQGRMHLYRTGIILLADVGLEFGLTKRCCTILDEIMPQIITGCDLEQRVLACFTLGRCIIAAQGGSESGLQEALKYLLVAEADCQTIQFFDALADVQYLISVVYHNLGMVADRDEAAIRHSVTLGEVKRLQNAGTDDEVEAILEILVQPWFYQAMYGRWPSSRENLE